jgi:hypothetical protein
MARIHEHGIQLGDRVGAGRRGARGGIVGRHCPILQRCRLGSRRTDNRAGVTWNAFPKELLVRFGRARALVEADRLWPMEAYHSEDYDPAKPGQAVLDASSRSWYRPHDEYCEWHVDREPATGRIRKVTFTSEPPEYWQAIFGGEVPIDTGVSYRFTGNPEIVLDLYRTLVSPEVRVEDLVFSETTQDGKRGDYNFYNKWNSTHGIAHLAAPPNSLSAEAKLGADATVLRVRPRVSRSPLPTRWCAARVMAVRSATVIRQSERPSMHLLDWAQ